MKRRSWVAAGVGVLSLIGVVAGTTPAGAADRAPATSYVKAEVVPAAVPSGCSSGYVCFWVNAGYNDGPGKLNGVNANWTVFSHSTCPNGTWADCISSAYNDGVNDNAVLWTEIGGYGNGLIIYRGAGVTDFSTIYNGEFNDKIVANSWAAP
jgi:hypothetical protein